MNRLAVAALVVALDIPAIAIAADRYKVTITRQDDNLYKVSGTDYWIKTKYCYEYVYGETAIMIWQSKGSYSNKLVFLNLDGEKKAECAIEALLVETSPS